MDNWSYISEIKVVDCDGNDIGIIKHKCDYMYVFIPELNGPDISADDYRHIADLLDSPWLTQETIATRKSN